MSFLRRLAATYVRIWRTYRGWMPTLLLLSILVFLPLGLLDALSLRVDLDSLDIAGGVKVAALMLAVGAVTMTGLLGEIFFSGAIAISLTHPHGEQPPKLREIAGRIKYGRLIVVDVVFVAIVALGLLLAVIPGVLAFIFLGLAGPIVEIEERSAVAALRRSFGLVRGSFWLVFWVLVPIELLGDAVGGGLAGLVHHQFGDTLLATWLAEALSDAVLSPLFAVAAVLLTVDLIAAREGEAPPLHSAPVTATA
ncbi:MAG TPA: hypothetical protein VFL77_07195 [Solirubrobacterales bacterium]|nr:hypothetical protein [Solirubrobacterales bacterium]